MDHAALSQLSKDGLIALLLAQEAHRTVPMAAQHAHIAELERRLGLNCGKPPFSDGLKKPMHISSLRKKSGKKSGGQQSHPGKTLRQTASPDATIDHFPETCAGCGTALNEAMAKHHPDKSSTFPTPSPCW